MTMLSFRVDEADARAVQRWVEALGIHRSELLREALRLHLDRLASEGDADRWDAAPLSETESREVVGIENVVLDVFSLRWRAGLRECRAPG